VEQQTKKNGSRTPEEETTGLLKGKRARQKKWKGLEKRVVVARNEKKTGSTCWGGGAKQGGRGSLRILRKGRKKAVGLPKLKKVRATAARSHLPGEGREHGTFPKVVRKGQGKKGP